jgi:hypothetical protein
VEIIIQLQSQAQVSIYIPGVHQTTNLNTDEEVMRAVQTKPFHGFFWMKE